VGIRIATLTNGGAEATRSLLERAGVAGLVERTVSVEEVRHWKPRREVYLHAAEVLDVEPSRLALVAAHAWDTHGAARAGLATVYVARCGEPFPAIMDPPDVSGPTLVEVARALAALPPGG
jgi:2-haloacid dehalogenase